MAVRLGFIGTGGVAQGHMRRFDGLPNAELVAFCDVVRQRAEKAAGEFGGKAYDKFEEMLAREELDAVVICTPPFAHGEIEAACCERGLHMLIEKPVGLDLDTARGVEAKVKEAGVVTVVAYKYRWDDHVNKARGMLTDKTIGLVHGSFWGGLPGTPWWRVMAQSGGQFVEQTTHIVDLARYLVGEVRTVQAYYALRAMHNVENLDVPDVGTVNLLFENGAVGNISNCCLLEGWGQSGLRVMAHKFTLQILGASLTWAGAEGAGEYQLEEDGYLGEDKAFLQAVETGDRSPIHSDYSDGVKTLAVTIAANLSAERGGEPVDVAGV